MSTPVIQVRNLGKRFRIGLLEKRPDTLVGQIGALLNAPLKNFRRLRDLSRFEKEDQSIIWALKDISFDVGQGEVLGVIGANGSGKSTLLKILSRITEPSKGEIRVKGRISALLEVGTGFHPELTGRENIYMNGTILGMTKREIDRKFEEIVDFSGIEQFIDTPVKFYSSGMKVRLGFSVAAHLEPEILLIDEVLSVGDAYFQDKCIKKINDVSRREGRTVIFVSHNMEVIPQLCEKGIWLNKGVIAGADDIGPLIHHYLRAYQEQADISKYLQDVKAFQDGDKIVLQCRYQADEILDIPHFGFVIYNQKGMPVTGANPSIDRIDRKYGAMNKKQGRIKVTVSSPKLTDGHYRVSVWFGNSKENFVEAPFFLDLFISGMTGQRQMPSVITGHALPECDWEFTD